MSAELIVEIILILIFGVFICIYGWPMLRGAPYAASNVIAVKDIADRITPLPGERACDLGSGDGRLVIALAKKGIETHGYEINRFLVWQSRRKIKKAGLAKLAFIHRHSYWKADLSSYTIVTLFGIPYIMKGLEEKLRKELPLGARVYCNRYKFPAWQPVKEENGVIVYVQS